MAILATHADATVATPALDGPVQGGRGVPFVAGTLFDLATVGYVQEEFFLGGTATAYTAAAAPTADGRWTVAPGATAAYRTRMLVHRPVDPRAFNGTVIVEWLNVSGGLDAAPDWIAAHTELIRSGYAWVGVSAQRVGVEGGSTIIGLPAAGLKMVDPARYGSLVHPGDSFSYDMFAQAGQALRQPQGASPLGTLQPMVIIAAGESQSAFRMVTFVNALHPVTGVYDGFLIHSRSAGGAALSEAPQPAVPVPNPTFIRDDLDVPVLVFQTETDLVTLGSVASRQDDGALVRLWEVAGTAHADTYTLGTGFTDRGDSPAVADLVVTSTPIAGFTCGTPINSGPQHWVLKAGVVALNRWVRRGTPPPRAPRIEVTPGSPPAIARDDFGNALGGIRTPQVDAPIAALSGVGQTGSTFCGLFGTTVPFEPVILSALYPSHRAYVNAFTRATKRAVRAGFVLRRDARLMHAAAVASSIGG